MVVHTSVRFLKHQAHDWLIGCGSCRHEYRRSESWIETQSTTLCPNCLALNDFETPKIQVEKPKLKFQQEPSVCRWAEADGVYDTTCNEEYALTNQDQSVGFEYCPYCGLDLVIEA